MWRGWGERFQAEGTACLKAQRLHSSLEKTVQLGHELQDGQWRQKHLGRWRPCEPCCGISFPILMALRSLWRRAHHCLHFRKLPRPVLEGLNRSKPGVREAAPCVLIITAESWEWKGAGWISLRDTEGLGREDTSEVSQEETGIVTLPGLLIWTAGWALVQQLLKTFKKLAPMKADFYLLAKDLEGPHPLILKGDVNTDTTLLVSEGSGIRHWFIFHSLVFLCHTF